MVNFQSSESEIFTPTGVPPPAALVQCLARYPGLFWFSTSGSLKRRWIGLSKEGVLVSAASVCQRLGVHANDRWCLCLPESHVGGFALRARAQVSGCQIVELRAAWSPNTLHRLLEDTRSTLVSLVPTQLYDLVKANLRSPPQLRVVLLGGAAVDRSLEQNALNLGWPVRTSYGLTEASSTVAIQETSLGELRTLTHLQLRLDSENRLELSGPSVARYQLLEGADQPIPATQDGWYRTGDMAELQPGEGYSLLTLLGRADRQIKILGELVSLDALERELTQILEKASVSNIQFVVVATPEPRRGAQLHLAYESENGTMPFPSLAQLNEALPGLKKLSSLRLLQRLPRLHSGKLDYRAITNLIQGAA